MTREACIKILADKMNEITSDIEKGIKRHPLPVKEDFTIEELGMIKAYLGPWPRALEAAGLKPEREQSRKELNKEKRIRARRRRSAARLHHDE